MTWEYYRQVEPVPPYTDLEKGFAAEVADPLWMLGRQWQVGEQHGEDASTPVVVTVQVAHSPLAKLAGQEPQVVPAEALIEGAADDFWTVGRRVRVGRTAAVALSAAERPKYLFTTLPEPYGDTLRGELDGLALANAGLLDPHDPALDGLADRPDFWNPHTLTYETSVSVGGVDLRIDGHRGGEVDWFTADASDVLAPASFAKRQVVPQRLAYPGAPAPRFWQIENAAVDIGGFPPDRSHLATALLIELICSHSDDWFTFPVPSPAPPADGDPAPSTGVVVTLGEVSVRDSFDDTWQLAVPPGSGDAPAGPDEPPGPWSLFRTKGLGRSSLVVWPTATNPLTGPVLDDVVLGVDEDANFLWAVELTVDGLALELSPDSAAALRETTRTGTRNFVWQPSTTLPQHWHPYRIEPRANGRVFVQGRVADLSHDPPELRPAARSELIGAGHGHELAATAVPNQGLRLQRQFALARATNSRPVLWRQRRTVPVLGGPVSHLRFDLLHEVAMPQGGNADAAKV
jgi:hypothetical protein